MKISGAKNIAEIVGMSPGAFRMMVSRDRENAPVRWELSDKNYFVMVANAGEIIDYVQMRRGGQNGGKRV